MFIRKYIFTVVLFFISFATYADPTIIRIITNQTDRPWTIISYMMWGHNGITFDSLSSVEKVCNPTDRFKEICILPPGKTTFVSYEYYSGGLYFTDGKLIALKAEYTPTKNGNIEFKISNDKYIKSINGGDINIIK